MRQARGRSMSIAGCYCTGNCRCRRNVPPISGLVLLEAYTTSYDIFCRRHRTRSISYSWLELDTYNVYSGQQEDHTIFPSPWSIFGACLGLILLRRCYIAGHMSMVYIFCVFARNSYCAELIGGDTVGHILSAACRVG